MKMKTLAIGAIVSLITGITSVSADGPYVMTDQQLDQIVAGGAVDIPPCGDPGACLPGPQHELNVSYLVGSLDQMPETLNGTMRELCFREPWVCRNWEGFTAGLGKGEDAVRGTPAP